MGLNAVQCFLQVHFACTFGETVYTVLYINPITPRVSIDQLLRHKNSTADKALERLSCLSWTFLKPAGIVQAVTWIKISGKFLKLS